jgi:methionine-S-sulfoxide reductase
VGYAGGIKENPTYNSLGGHSETIQIDYDPAQISYQELLDVFWDSDTPTSPSFSSQYKSIIFYHDEEQKRLALETKEREEARLKARIYTELVPFSGFYLAEAYHQKYYLRLEPEIMKEFSAIYPDAEDFTNSTAAARLNGYAGDYGIAETLREGLSGFGLSAAGNERLLEMAARGFKPGCAYP